jgi:hypothetical protein
MDQDYLKIFEKCVGDQIKHKTVANNLIEKYRNTIVGPKENTDLVTQIWENHGFATYMNV